ncbi:hypothetical protein DASC09_025280 [Saccharomycopsis crataegensis]|uniref:LAGLIDADG endonuclease n=1 Tax=Saccharomycopsis crataegensis TaxID=43959 RepID=A0AAV5QM17_9ASCO|nr:hypothetical protein DASC09_025280 [Saccharomycopsis crataegensis]
MTTVIEKCHIEGFSNFKTRNLGSELIFLDDDKSFRFKLKTLQLLCGNVKDSKFVRNSKEPSVFRPVTVKLFKSSKVHY